MLKSYRVRVPAQVDDAAGKTSFCVLEKKTLLRSTVLTNLQPKAIYINANSGLLNLN